MSRWAAKISTLKNGIRVATEGVLSPYCTLGVAINSGSRYEVGYPLGVSHMIEKLAYSSTRNFNRDQILTIMEEQGALIDCQCTKDTFLYASSCRSSGTDQIMSIIADAVLRPSFLEEEIEMTRDVISFEYDHHYRTAEPEALLVDFIHSAAYQGNTVGLSRFCNPENSGNISRKHLFTYISQYHDPSRIVVAGVGVDHDQLVEATDKYFNSSNTAWAMEPQLLLPNPPVIDDSVAQYTGGEFRKVKDLSSITLGPRTFPNLAHFVLAFESVGLKHPDFVPFCVLNSLMGGGGSFSAGGPGKGMYTRLYVDVLHNYHWMYNATATNHSYADTGIFTIRASAPPQEFTSMAKVILNEFFRLTNGVSHDELQRAKTQLKSQILMNLEMRPVQFEDLARQVLTHGKRIKPDEYAEQINAVTADDIVRLASRMLASKPAVAGYGDLKAMPSFDKFDCAVAKRSLNELNASSSYWKTSLN